MPGTGFWLTRGFANDLMLRLSDFYDRFLAESSLPYAVVVSEEHRKARPGGGPNLYRALVSLLEPALAAAREPAERTRAMSRCLRVLIALQARPPQEGDAAPKLADLGLPAAVTTDPFDDQPLRLKQLPEGWIVYSVGGNLVDDGGKLDGKTDIGPARPGSDMDMVTFIARFSRLAPATSHSYPRAPFHRGSGGLACSSPSVRSSLCSSIGSMACSQVFACLPSPVIAHLSVVFR